MVDHAAEPGGVDRGGGDEELQADENGEGHQSVGERDVARQRRLGAEADRERELEEQIRDELAKSEEENLLEEGSRQRLAGDSQSP